MMQIWNKSFIFNQEIRNSVLPMPSPREASAVSECTVILSKKIEGSHRRNHNKMFETWKQGAVYIYKKNFKKRISSLRKWDDLASTASCC